MFGGPGGGVGEPAGGGATGRAGAPPPHAAATPSRTAPRPARWRVRRLRDPMARTDSTAAPRGKTGSQRRCTCPSREGPDRASSPSTLTFVRTRQEQFQVLSLWNRGCFNKSQLARAVGLPRCTVRNWIQRFAGVAQWAEAAALKAAQWGFESLHQHQRRPYAYLLGMYLGDGTSPLTRGPTGCGFFSIVISCASFRNVRVLLMPCSTTESESDRKMR
jgi:hypothetical protein